MSETLIEIAIEIATNAHKGQVDKNKAPYILHPLRVMSNFIKEDYQVVAVLHDVIEDCDLTLEALCMMGIPIDLANDVDTLSRSSEEDYKTFINRVGESNKRVIAIKIADMEDNMRFDRCFNPGMYKRYVPNWKYLKERQYDN